MEIIVKVSSTELFQMGLSDECLECELLWTIQDKLKALSYFGISIEITDEEGEY